MTSNFCFYCTPLSGKDSEAKLLMDLASRCSSEIGILPICEECLSIMEEKKVFVLGCEDVLWRVHLGHKLMPLNDGQSSIQEVINTIINEERDMEELIAITISNLMALRLGCRGTRYLLNGQDETFAISLMEDLSPSVLCLLPCTHLLSSIRCMIVPLNVLHKLKAAIQFFDDASVPEGMGSHTVSSMFEELVLSSKLEDDDTCKHNWEDETKSDIQGARLLVCSECHERRCILRPSV